MKHRTPVICKHSSNIIYLSIFILHVYTKYLFLIFSLFLGTIVIGIVLAYIFNAIGALAENERFKQMTDAEKSNFLKRKRNTIFQKII